VELIGGTDLGRGRVRQMEHGHDGRRESGQGHTAGGRAGARAGPRSTSGGDAAKGGVRSGVEAHSAPSEQVTWTEAVRVRCKGSGRLIWVSLSVRTTYKQHYCISILKPFLIHQAP
jgi:hypothetical protein